MMQRQPGSSVTNRRATSMPSGSGICRSSTTASGRSRSAVAIVASPEPA